MTDRERQRQLDLLAMQFVAALEAGDFEAVDRLWAVAAAVPELEAVLLESAAEVARMNEAEGTASGNGAVARTANRDRPRATKTGETRRNRNLHTENRPMDQKQNMSRRGMLATAAAAAFGPILVRHESEVQPTLSRCGLENALCATLDGEVAARVCSMELKDVEAHYHKRTTEIYYILDGQGTISLNGKEHLVNKGSFIHIPPGVVHSVKGPLRVLIMGVPAISTDEDMFFPSADGVAERPLGVWTRTAGDVLVKLDFRENGFRAAFTKSGESIVVDSDFTVTEDAVFMARVRTSKRTGIAPEQVSGFDPRFTPTAGDEFSFRVGMREGGLAITDLRGCGAGKPLVEGEYGGPTGIAVLAVDVGGGKQLVEGEYRRDVT